MNNTDIESVTRLCPFCEACCGLEVKVNKRLQTVISVKGDKKNPFSKGYVCPKSQGLKLLEEDPDRLKTPLIKQGRDFVETSYDDALDRAAYGIKKVIRKSGNDALAMHIGNPVAHNLGLVFYAGLFHQMIPTRNAGTSGSIDHISKVVSSVEMFGSEAFVPVPDIDRTKHIVIIGANPMVSNGSLVTAPDFPRRLKELKNRGGKIIVIDPKRTKTSDIADTHVFLKPGTDAYLLLAMVDVLFKEGLINLGRLEFMVDGIETLREKASQFNPERVTEVTGVQPDDIRHLAREMATAEAAVMYGRIGTSAQKFGAVTSWLIDVVNLLTGNLDSPGGAMFPKPITPSVIYNKSIENGVSPNNRWHTRVGKLPEVSGFIPVAAFADEILTPGHGQVKAMLTLCANPARSVPNSGRMEQALSALEFMASIDIYLNETTRFSDVILPPSSHLHQVHYPPFSPPYMVRSYAKWDEATFTSETRSDGELMLALNARIHDLSEHELDRIAIEGAVTNLFSENRELAKINVQEAISQLEGNTAPEKFIDLIIRTGPFGDHFGLHEGISLARLKNHKHGLDLGAMVPQLPALLKTPNKNIQAAPNKLVADIDRLEREMKSYLDENKLLLIGRRHICSNNSWMHNIKSLAKGPDRTTLLVNPLDAEKRGLKDGDKVHIHTPRATVDAVVEKSIDVMAGVISLPHGFGHNSEATRLSVANTNPGPNFNALLDESCADAVSGSASLSGIPVDVVLNN